jgi:hypothetical protein
MLPIFAVIALGVMAPSAVAEIFTLSVGDVAQYSISLVRLCPFPKPNKRLFLMDHRLLPLQ